jgi:hypothetical protein
LLLFAFSPVGRDTNPPANAWPVAVHYRLKYVANILRFFPVSPTCFSADRCSLTGFSKFLDFMVQINKIMYFHADMAYQSDFWSIFGTG